MDANAVNALPMDLDELFAKRPGDPLTLLCKQDLDPFSVEELQLRIDALGAEIERTRARMQAAVNHRASADALFKR
jgi:uncharacterized small protein (DUF1192 family)